MRRLVSGVGARLGLALFVVLAGALALVYLIVVPSLESRLTHSRLSQLGVAAPGIVRELPSDRLRWPDFLEAASASANARVVVYDTVGPPTALVVVGDSQGFNSTDAQRDPSRTTYCVSGVPMSSSSTISRSKVSPTFCAPPSATRSAALARVTCGQNVIRSIARHRSALLAPSRSAASAATTPSS